MRVSPEKTLLPRPEPAGKTEQYGEGDDTLLQHRHLVHQGRTVERGYDSGRQRPAPHGEHRGQAEHQAQDTHSHVVSFLLAVIGCNLVVFFCNQIVTFLFPVGKA